MPYPFAHPAAVLPLIRPMGRFGVTSALVIGSMVPDAWYLVPGLERADSHSAAGLLWFCLPLGFLLYLVWNGPRPSAPFYAVATSLLVGALTHLGWDAVAHAYAYGGVHVLQHASTVLGTAAIVWWYCRSAWPVLAAAGLLVALGTAAFALAPDLDALRGTLRQGFVSAAWILATALLAWRLISARATAPRAPRAPSPRTPGR
jgi:hypothetical protein